MKTPHSTLYRYTAEAIAEANKLPVGTVNEQSHKRGMEQGDGLIVAIDCMVKYAEAYRIRFDGPLSDDYILGPLWLQSLKGLKGLLDGDAEIALRKGITTDTKDNGVCCEMIASACRHAGFDYEEL